ncbi:MAG: ABC transporter permease [Acidimicrobiales bacterium]
MTAYLRLEVLRVLRNSRYLLLSLATPVGFYLLFTSIFGAESAEGLAQPVEAMVSMAAYGAIGAVLFTTGPRVATEREAGWLRQLRATPLPAGKVIAAKVLAAMALGLPAVVVVSITAGLVQGVRLTAGEWTGFIAVTTLGTAPFAMLGLLIGYLADSDSAHSLTLAAWFVLPAIGGLWMPLRLLPEALRAVGRVLPTNRLGDLGWRIAAGQGPRVSSGLILLGWTAGLAVLAAWSYRRSSVAG